MPGSNSQSDPQPLDFEAAMRDLEEIVERLEHGDLPLEDSLKAFERGIMLTRNCQTALKNAEQKVEILLKKAGEARVEDFGPNEPKSGCGRTHRPGARTAGTAGGSPPVCYHCI